MLFGRKVHLSVRDAAEARAALAPWLEARGIAVGSLEQVPPSLEDVVVGLIRRAGGAVEG